MSNKPEEKKSKSQPFPQGTAEDNFYIKRTYANDLGNSYRWSSQFPDPFASFDAEVEGGAKAYMRGPAGTAGETLVDKLLELRAHKNDEVGVTGYYGFNGINLYYDIQFHPAKPYSPNLAPVLEPSWIGAFGGYNDIDGDGILLGRWVRRGTYGRPHDLDNNKPLSEVPRQASREVKISSKENLPPLNRVIVIPPVPQ
jgi:hypothetical protein